MSMNTTVTPNVPVNKTPTIEPEQADLHYYKLANDVYIIADIIILIVGLLGNLATLLVMQRKGINKTPVSVYMSALAVTDTLVLILDFLNNWLSLTLNIGLLSNHHFCLFHRYVFTVCYTYSSWLLATLTFERFLAVTFPLTAKVVCTVKHALVTIIVEPIILFVVSSYNLWAWEVNEKGKCTTTASPKMAFFINHVAPWMRYSLYSFIPIILIFFFNISITIQLFRAHSHRVAMTGETVKASSHNERKITIMVLTVSFVFLLLTAPVAFWYIIVFAAEEFTVQGPKAVFIETVIIMFGLCNYAVNFFLYILSSRSFRQEFMTMIKCKAPLEVHNVHSAETHSQPASKVHQKTQSTTSVSDDTITSRI